MGAVYQANFEDVSATVAQDFFEIAAGATVPVVVRRFRISSGKTASEIARLTVQRYSGSPTSGSGGTTPTIRKVAPSYGTASSTVEANNTTRISGGTKETHLAEEWNIITPFEFAPLDRDGMIEVPAAKWLTVSIEGNPAASTKFSGWIEWEEVG
jgi:hypothetical protein